MSVLKKTPPVVRRILSLPLFALNLRSRCELPSTSFRCLILRSELRTSEYVLPLFKFKVRAANFQVVVNLTLVINLTLTLNNLILAINLALTLKLARCL